MAPRLEASLSAGRLLVRAADTVPHPELVSATPKPTTDGHAAEVAQAVTVERDGDVLRVHVPDARGRGRPPQVLVEVAVPTGTDVAAQAGEAEVVATGRLGRLTARTSSGSVAAEQVVGTVDIRTGRGPVTIHSCGGGSVDVTDAVVIVRESHGALDLRGRSGDMHAWRLAGPTTVTTTTGNVRLGWAADHAVALDVETDTGRRRVSVTSTPDAADTLRVRTLTGDVTITPARSEAAAPRGGQTLLRWKLWWERLGVGPR